MVGGGFTIWLTGLPAAGKTTLAEALAARLAPRGLTVTILDGDRLREAGSRDLGFDRASRAEQARRTARLALAAATQGRVALVALVSPYRRDRQAARELHRAHGVEFVELYVATPLSECERRDPKRLYARGRQGELSQVTGLDDPYEPPTDAELVLGSQNETLDETTSAAVSFLAAHRMIPPVVHAPSVHGR